MTKVCTCWMHIGVFRGMSCSIVKATRTMAVASIANVFVFVGIAAQLHSSNGFPDGVDGINACAKSIVAADANACRTRAQVSSASHCSSGAAKEGEKTPIATAARRMQHLQGRAWSKRRTSRAVSRCADQVRELRTSIVLVQGSGGRKRVSTVF